MADFISNIASGAPSHNAPDKGFLSFDEDLIALYVSTDASGGHRKIAGEGAPFLTTATKTSSYTITDNDYYIRGDATGGNITVTLPTAVGRLECEFLIKRIDGSGNTCTLDGDGAETIDGSTTISMSQYDVVRVISDGTNWDRLNP